jgi:glyoxylase-like metal-dependent hydrolase (beta-lactamase superfamily II)
MSRWHSEVGPQRQLEETGELFVGASLQRIRPTVTSVSHRAGVHPPRPKRSRAAMANEPFPSVEKVRDGLWSVPVPLPNNSLRYVLVYVFETKSGPYLIDAGWNTDDAFQALENGLTEVGCEVSDVQGVMVTHIHPDHYGLAGRIRDASGAWISLHPADAELIHDRYNDPDDLLARVASALRTMGAPIEELDALQNAAMPVRSLVDAVKPDVLLEDGARPEVPGWDLTAIWTPGHSPGHLCFYEASHNLMLSGDHVLPRITPNIPFHPQAGANPLGDFLASLDKLEPYLIEEVLPAHEYRFKDLRTRLEELRQHHRDRFGELTAILRDGPHSAWYIASRMPWSRDWGDIVGFMRRAAVSETVAHLKVLEIDGVVEVVDGEPAMWSLRE